ncbi:MAG: Eco57I restriction-modification methylase domain-containing protein [Deltaproteobacteria bacterium]|nr:Eco57I restriction-modification methylase domain-containing protein [Deltaproteobacteria bacterium]
MQVEEAKRLIKETFQNTFDEGRFRLFAKNLFNGLDESKASSRPFQGQYIPEAYKEHVRQYKRLGTYTDPAGAALDVMIVNLKHATSLERARTRQRNFIAWYLKNRGEKDAAIVAYHTEGLEDWRFSYVRMDYRPELNEKGKVRIATDLTPARRYSFLVGKNEPNHTAQQQLLPILQDDCHNPTLAELEKAFTIESVTREFFERYKELFLKLKDELDALLEKDQRIGADFAAKNIKTTDFAKKLLGQIVFLYFLQKKGWLGVGKDEQGNFREWGAGPKNFLQRLYGREIVPYDNFFNDLLEPLFYEALATDRGEESYYSRFRCKIPFLNGGLFEPIGGYSWEQIDILIQNETFKDIFETFNLYNFTVREDEPLEKEVAVDPEMLGKVFENLLEVKDRKSKGAYYTPREIVHYMCRESLINYLAGALNGGVIGYERLGVRQSELFGPKDLAKPDGRMELMAQNGPSPVSIEDIRLLICQGEFGIENDLAKEQGTKSYAYKLPESIRANAWRIDQALADIKICDPAIGSGAFPVGMLHEIVRARETLTTYLPENPARTPYHFKRHAIQQSIYGVDIDCGAVDIAKLRLWLSLVVDEDDFLSIKPLPNLDYKIVCGNSLLRVERNLLNNHLFEELELLKQRYFDEINPRQKKEEKSRIEQLIRQLTNNDEQFDFEIYFSEVYHSSHSPLTERGRKGGGFDVVIANPPYVRQEAIKEFKPQFKRTFGAFYCGTADLYTYFYKRGLEILKPSGHLCFIAPNKFMRAGYGKNTRTLLANEATPKVVIDFGDLPIFDATTYPSILLLEKRKPEATEKTLTATFTVADQLANLDDTLANIGFTMPVAALKAEGWTLERPDVLALMEKLRKAGKPLGEYVQGKFYYGIKTGLNEAFVIDEATRQQLIAEDPESAKLIKPWLRGRDIRKWKAQWAGLYVIFTRRGTDIKKYPAIKRHLEQFRSALEPKKSDKDLRGRKPGTYKWFEIQDNIAYFEEFEKTKIMYAEISTEGKFLLETEGYYSDTTTYIISSSSEYLLGVLNSKLFTYIFSKTSSEISGGFFRWKRQYMELLPLFPATDAQKAPIIEHVKKILTDPDSSAVRRLEAEIDKLVYTLYKLTPEEIKIIEKEQ